LTRINSEGLSNYSEHTVVEIEGSKKNEANNDEYPTCMLLLGTTNVMGSNGGLHYIFRTNVAMNYTEVEAKVREATNDEAWGPTGMLMQEIARYTFVYEHFSDVMSMLWKRMLLDNKKNWRRVYKVCTN